MFLCAFDECPKCISYSKDLQSLCKVKDFVGETQRQRLQTTNQLQKQEKN